MVLAKSSIQLSQISDRVNKGAEGIELQLVDDFSLLRHEKEGYGHYVDKKLLEFLKQGDMPSIEVVHTPLFQKQDYVIEAKESEEVIRQSAALAQFFAEIQQKDVFVVIHTREDVRRLQSYGRLEKIQQFVYSLLENYPNIFLLFENLTFLTFSSSAMETYAPITIQDGKIQFSNIELARCLNNPRCGTVIDTCHAIMTQNLFANWQEYYQTNIFDVDVMEAIFQQSEPYTRLIHLGNAMQHGCNHFHGLPFKKEKRGDIVLLNQIMRNYRQYGNGCPITIEVRESDYDNALNFSATLDTLYQVQNTF